MSFEHRFGAGIGGSPEDPYQPQCCDECRLDKCRDKCEVLDEYINGDS